MNMKVDGTIKGMPVKEMQIVNGTELHSVQCIEWLYIRYMQYASRCRMKSKNFFFR